MAIATDKIHISVLNVIGHGALTQELDAGRLSLPLVARLHGERLRHPGIRQYYEKFGGVRIFGQPLGEPVMHYAGTTQFFERYALVLDPAGKISLLDPTADDEGRGDS